MAKQHMSKKGRERFLKRKTPKNERGHKRHGAAPPPNPAGVGKKKGQQQQLKRHRRPGEPRRTHGARKKKGGAADGGAAMPQGYSLSQRILLVGEGNLSMARALLRLFGGDGSNIVATTYDDEATLREAREARKGDARREPRCSRRPRQCA